MTILNMKEIRYNKAIIELMKDDKNGAWDEILEFEAENNLDLAYDILKERLHLVIENTKDCPEQQEFYIKILKRL